MPLVLMSGLPASGKTKVAISLQKYLKDKGRQVSIVSDSNVSSDFERDSFYGNATSEKQLRGEFLSAIQRKISKTKVLIVDSMNYIKGKFKSEK